MQRAQSRRRREREACAVKQQKGKRKIEASARHQLEGKRSIRAVLVYKGEEESDATDDASGTRKVAPLILGDPFHGQRLRRLFIRQTKPKSIQYQQNQPVTTAMKKQESFLSSQKNWTYEFFIELISNSEEAETPPKKHDIGIKKKEAPNSLAGLLGLQKMRSNPTSIESKGEPKTREIIEETLANEAPAIKPKTKLHKIVWYRIWLYFVLRGVLDKDYFIEHFTNWRESKGSRYFEVLCFTEKQATNQKSTPIDIFLLCGIPSKEEMDTKIELIAPLISHQPIKKTTKKGIIEVIGRKNLGEIKIVIDKAINSGKIAELRKSTRKNTRHKYSGNRADLYREMVKIYGLKTKESIFTRGVSEFVETKAK